jgi:predicted AlkP superfamily phosphohydrolase/phosphomutase
MIRGAVRLALVSILATAWVGCELGEPGGEADRGRPRILLVAVDGLEWGVVLPLVRAGRMPELERLMTEGTYGLLRTARPTVCPRIWASVATGRTADRHGIEGFTRWDARSPDRERLYLNTDRDTKAFWEILTDHGLRVHVVGWWTSLPVDEIRGVMLSRLDVGSREEAGSLGGVDGLVHPPERQDDMLDLVGRSGEALPWLRLDMVDADGRGGSGQARDLLEASDWAIRSDAAHAAVARRLAGEEPAYDLLAVYLAGADVVGHRFWRYFEPDRFSHRPEPEDVAPYGRVIPAYYEFVDRVIGRLRRAGSGDEVVVVLSDHGMSPSNTSAAFPAHARGRELRSGHHAHGPDGILVAAGPGIRRGTRKSPREVERSDLEVVGSVFDVTPTLLSLLRIPTGEDMDGKVLTALLSDGVPATPPIPSHDSLEWLGSRLDREPPELDRGEYLAKLRALGCLE